VVAAARPLSNWTYVFDVLSVVGALGYWLTRNRGTRPSLTWIWLVAAISILSGLFMAFSAIGAVGIGPIVIGFMAPWVALMQPPGKPDERTEFAGLVLPPLAVLQALHAFLSRPPKRRIRPCC